MANIGTLLKAEIARLSRREVRKELQASNKASAQHRRYIAGLKRQVAQLEHQMAALQRRVKVAPTTASNGADGTNGANGANGTKYRFVAKGFRSHRARLGLSAAECGKLLGVSAQSIYNWEHNVAVPRREQVMRIAALRALGKREARARLEQLGS
ncbi:MAG: hypothetical protein M3Z31_08980 [Pseudomonadota bacterium]|nr:hypothetical protein [Pseudomonadota bacterium]